MEFPKRLEQQNLSKLPKDILINLIVNINNEKKQIVDMSLEELWKLKKELDLALEKFRCKNTLRNMRQCSNAALKNGSLSSNNFCKECIEDIFR